MGSHVGSGSGRAVSARRRARVVAVRCAWGGEGGIDFDLDQRDDHDRRDGDDEHVDSDGNDDGCRARRDQHCAHALVVDDDRADPSSGNDDHNLDGVDDARAFDAARAGCATGRCELR
jgi:hypothetical protein